MDKVLLYFALKYNGNWQKIYDALDKKEKITQEELEAVEEQIDCEYITVLHPLYPHNLKNSHEPPFVLFYQGNFELLIGNTRILTYFFEEKMEKESLECFERLTTRFVTEKKVFLVSETNLMANFVNKVIKEKTTNWIELKGSIKGESRSETSLVISESYEVNGNDSLFRLRLLGSLPENIVVLEVAQKGELEKIVDYALEENRDVFVLPLGIGIKNRANNKFIKLGAKLVENASDVLQ